MKTTKSILSLFMFAALFSGCGGNKSNSTNGAALNVGYQNSPVSTLLMVAKSKGFFDTTGVKVNLTGFTAGKFAITALVSGKGLDLALSGELPIPLAVIQGNKLNVITQVVSNTNNECRIIALKTKGVQTPEQYFATPRKIATSLNGTPEYYLSAFLKVHHIDSAKVSIIGMKPEDMTSALLSKSVDAICIFDPVASIAAEKIGNQGIVFQDSNIYSALYIVSGLDKTVAGKKPELIKFIKALGLAAQWVKAKPDSARLIVSGYTKLDKTVLEHIWKSYNFDIALTPKLNDYFIDETKWIRKKNSDKSTAMPDYRDSVINTTILQAVAPEKITLK